jgi:tRNA threonylcarbamoyladenosine biosynthesis protein TsaB
MMHGHAEALLPMIDDIMSATGLSASALDCVAVTTGPGSFTGIRVGIAAARGIAFAGGLPLIGVSSFEAVAEAVPAITLGDRPLLVALESRRADLYIQLFDAARRPLSEPAVYLPQTLASGIPSARGSAIVIIGDAVARAAAPLAEHYNVATVATGLTPAVGALSAALRRRRRGERGGEVRPLYLRPPDVTVPGGYRPQNP